MKVNPEFLQGINKLLKCCEVPRCTRPAFELLDSGKSICKYHSILFRAKYRKYVRDHYETF
jgi:hypothetical protein